MPSHEIGRQEAIHELIYTEDDYVRDLRILDQVSNYYNCEKIWCKGLNNYDRISLKNYYSRNVFQTKLKGESSTIK